MLRVILFDADDTLYEEKHAKVAAEMTLAEEVAKLTGGDMAEMYRRFIHAKDRVLKSQKGDPHRNERMRWIQALLEDLELPLSHTEKLASLYWDRVTEEIRPYADAKIVLPILAKKYPLFVLTNENLQHAKRKLEAVNLLRYFKDIVSAFDVGTEKPGKAFFDAALARAGVEAKDAVMVGNDPRSDIRGANSSGIISAFLRRGPFSRYTFQTEEETPKYTVSDFFEFQQLLSDKSNSI